MSITKMFIINKRLSKTDLEEFRALVRLVAQKTFVYNQIRNNTALIPKGKALAEQEFAVLGVLQQAVQSWIGQTLMKYNCVKGMRYNINGESGKITAVAPTNEIITPPIK